MPSINIPKKPDTEVEKKPTEPKAEPKAAKKEEEAAPTEVIFVSSDDEPKQFDIAGVRGMRDETGKKVMWRVPVDRAERFARHSFVLSGRVVRA